MAQAIGQLLAAMQAQIDQLRAEVRRSGDLHARLSSQPAVRWAKTVAISGSYPAASTVPNTYGIVFVDGIYTQTAGAHATTWSDRQAAACTVVQNVADGQDSYIPVGTVIPVWPGRGGLWWTDWHTPNVEPVTFGGSTAGGGTGSVTLPNGRTVAFTNYGPTVTLGETGIAWRSATTHAWYALKGGGSAGPPGAGVSWYRGTFHADLRTTDASVQVDDVVDQFDGSAVGVVTALNTWKQAGESECEVLLLRDWNGYYYVAVPQHSRVKKVVDVLTSSGALYKVTRYFASQIDSVETNTDVVDFVDTSAVYNVAWTGSVLQQSKVSLHVLGSASDDGASTVFTPVTVQSVIDVRLEGLELIETIAEIKVWATGDEADSTIYIGTNCMPEE